MQEAVTGETALTSSDKGQPPHIKGMLVHIDHTYGSTIRDVLSGPRSPCIGPPPAPTTQHTGNTQNMTSTPINLRRRVREPLSHERLLRVCFAYQRLRDHVRNIQNQIDEAIEEFQTSTRSQESITRMITSLAQIDGGINAELHDDILTVELETIHWQDRSAKLRSEAKRQARMRLERSDRGNPSGVYLNGTNASDSDDDNDDLIRQGANDSETTNPFEATPAAVAKVPIISPTMARVLKGMAELPPDLGEPKAPDNATFKKSGLV